MKSKILLLSILTLSAAYPLSEPNQNLYLGPETSTTQEVLDELNGDFSNAVYKQNFKKLLTEYVMTEEKDLTFNERDKVESIIEGMLENMVRDFRIIRNKDDIEVDFVLRVNDASFDEIHKVISVGVPDLNEHNALRLAYRLENTLMNAREKLDRVIHESRAAKLQNNS